jgi:hypothetical protein
MSFQAMTWAVEQELPAMQKIVLLMLANRTNPETGLCFPSHDTLAKECGMDKRSVIRQIEKLEKSQLLKVTRSTNKANSYVLNLHGDRKSHSDSVSPRAVTESHLSSDTKSPETEIKLKSTITTNDVKNVLSVANLNVEQRDCYEWAQTHNYWHTTTVSIEQFLTIYHKPSKNGLRAQFQNEKALQDGRGQTGLVQSQSMKKNTGGDYATHYPNNKKLTAAQRAKQLGERANACNDRNNIIDSTATHL